MKQLDQIQIDNSWRVEYDRYLEHCSRKCRPYETSDISPDIKSQISYLHTSAFSILFNVAQAKKPVQNIYKRPI